MRFLRPAADGLGLSARAALEYSWIDTRSGGSLGHGVSTTACVPRALWTDALTKVVLADANASVPLLRRLGAQAALVYEDATIRTLS